MSMEGEQKLADTAGRFAWAVRDGRPVGDVRWTSGRILLSNRRLILVARGGKRSVPLASIDGVGARRDVNQAIATVSDYVSLPVGDDVLVVAPGDDPTFVGTLYGAMLAGQAILVKHPAVRGGVVQSVEWARGRIKIDPDEVALALASGAFVRFQNDDVATVDRADRSVDDDTREVLEVGHTDEGQSVVTYFSADDRTLDVLEALFRRAGEGNDSHIDLSPLETEILMSLYTGVTPFDIPDFVDEPIDEVEEIFERLVELEVLQEVRLRREVTLKARGRNIASDAMNSQ
jgi:helix-turn-helix protein